MSVLTTTLSEHGIELDTDRSAVKDDTLITQTEARKLAAVLNADGTPKDTAYIAHAVPMNAWGGTEHGWTVSLVGVAV